MTAEEKFKELRKNLTLLISVCYSKELSVCPKHIIFQPQKFLNKLLEQYTVIHRPIADLTEENYKRKKK